MAAALFAAALAHNAATYLARNETYREWSTIDANNRRLVSEAGDVVSAECAVVGASRAVRGYLNLLVGRGVYEWQRVGTLRRTARKAGACATVYLYADAVWTDLPRVRRILVVDAAGDCERASARE